MERVREWVTERLGNEALWEAVKNAGEFKSQFTVLVLSLLGETRFLSPFCSIFDSLNSLVITFVCSGARRAQVSSHVMEPIRPRTRPTR